MRLTKGGAVAPRPLSRPTPVLGVHQQVTYSVKSPRSTHTRPATCEEVGCKAFRQGWTLTVPIGTDKIEHAKQLMRGELDGIKRLDAKIRRYGAWAPSEPAINALGGLVDIQFAPGTPCTRATRHRVTLNRPELYVVRGGDWRGSTGVIRRHTKPEHWVEDFETNLARSRRVLNGRS